MTDKFKAPFEALEKLKKGNQDYISALTNPASIELDLRKNLATNGQQPYAVILTCSDSRVAPEHIFSAGLGELFVIRTAGNVVGDFELGSIEYGVEHLGAPIIVVMGHNHCGAVEAALSGHAEGYIEKIVHKVKNVITGAENAKQAEEMNILNSIQDILKSDIVSRLIQTGKISLVGAKYDIETGLVDFYKSES